VITIELLRSPLGGVPLPPHLLAAGILLLLGHHGQQPDPCHDRFDRAPS
jgi:hypothetical protein